MKIAKIILSIVTMLFALLGLLKVIPFDIANSIMFLALATLLVLRSTVLVCVILCCFVRKFKIGELNSCNCTK